MVSLCCPTNRSHSVWQPQITQFCYFRVLPIPEVYVRGESNSQKILISPVNKVEIEIILKSRSIKNFERHFTQFSSHFDRSYQFTCKIKLFMSLLSLQFCQFSLGLTVAIFESVVVAEKRYWCVNLYRFFWFSHYALSVYLCQRKWRRVWRRWSILVLRLLFSLRDIRWVGKAPPWWNEPVSHNPLLRKGTLRKVVWTFAKRI